MEMALEMVFGFNPTIVLNSLGRPSCRFSTGAHAAESFTAGYQMSMMSIIDLLIGVYSSGSQF